MRMDRPQKEAIIVSYAADLMEMAESYAEAAKVVGRLPDDIVNAMCRTAIETDAIHAAIVDAIENK